MNTPYKRIGAMALAFAVLAGVTGSTATARPKARTNPQLAPPPQPATPAGLDLNGRTLDRQDVPSYVAPGAASYNAANVSARVQGEQGTTARSTAPLWADSDQSTAVVVSLGDGYLVLDKIDQDDDVTSVRLHDEAGNCVTMTQRVSRWYGQAESIEGSVRVDAQGNLLPLPVARVIQAQDGSVIVSRDGDFAEALTVAYRLSPAGRAFASTRFVTIAAGEAAAVIQGQGQTGDVLVLRAGSGYTPAPSENSDVIRFK